MDLMTQRDVLVILGLTFLPSAEGRYAILYAAVNGLPLEQSLLTASMGVVLLALFLSRFIHLVDMLIEAFGRMELGRFTPLARRLYNWYRGRVLKRSRNVKGKMILLIAFIAAPFPGTGMWTGSLVGHIGGMDRRSLFLSLIIGGLLSNIIVYVAIRAGLEFFTLFSG